MVFRSLLDRFYCRKTDGYTAMIIGLDGAGKTTMMYKLILGQVITTIPTIGFNVETVKAPTTSGQDLKMTMWDVGPGCGMRYYVQTILHYTTYTDAIIWVVDSSDHSPGLLDESVDLLAKLLRAIASEHSRQKKDKYIPILILANKQDKPGAMKPLQVYNKFAPICARSVFSVFPTSTTENISMGGIPEAFDWLRHVIENPVPAIPDATISTMPTSSEPTSTDTLDSGTSPILSDKLSSWISRAETDSSPEEFITQFESINLPAWDHYTHIRIAYTILTTHGRQKGKNMIFDGIERYIAKSTQTRVRTFHVTMTYFWIQMVHFGIRSMPPMYALPTLTTHPLDSSATLVEELVATQKSETVSPSLGDFSAFLMLNPYVTDGNLWADYYSKDVMMSPEAKTGVVLPDKKPLPNLVVRDALATKTVKAI